MVYEILDNGPEEVLNSLEDIKKVFPSKEVLRKLKYEFIQKSRLDKDPLLEVIKFKKLQQDHNITYIREISYSPMKVLMFHVKIFKDVILNELKLKKCLDLHLDCTGSLFHKFTEKRAFYYSISLASIKNYQSSRISSQISVCDAIMADHSTLSIKRVVGVFY